MSISVEYAKEHQNESAVLCCRAEEGTVLTAHSLEDPAIFDDLIDSGLLNIEGALTIGQVIGAVLTKTADSLTPVSIDMVDKVKGVTAESAEERQDEAVSMIVSPTSQYGGVLKLHIGEGKDIDIELPLGITGENSTIPAVTSNAAIKSEAETKDVVAHSLKKLQFSVKEVKLGKKTSFENGILTVREELSEEALDSSEIIKDVKIDLITPDKQDVYTDTMMDICPIAVKKEGNLGNGITYEMTGAVVMLTGVEESGLQCADAAASNGIFSEKCIFGRPGCPDKEEYVIRIHVVIKDGFQMERPGPMAAHRAADIVTQEIREVLRAKAAEEAQSTIVLDDVKHIGKPRVLYVKEIMGQGAMHDNLILPSEPCGYSGARPNVDLGNMPVFLRVNEVRDGGIHALTCITPDTKETTRLYFREPIVDLLANDPEICFLGVLFVGSPQACTEKFYVSERIGATVEAMNIDGCIVSTEGFGNNHVDFASHIEQIGRLDIPLVGTSFCGVQGALVVGNKYMDAMVDMCVTPDGWESDNLCENQLTKEVADRCVAMLKNKMMGVPTEAALKKWSAAVTAENVQALQEKAI